MGEVVPARTSLTLHPLSPPTVHQLLRLALEELIYGKKIIALIITLSQQLLDIFNVQMQSENDPQLKKNTQAFLAQ